MTVHAKKRDIDEYASGAITYEQFGERVIATTTFEGGSALAAHPRN
jgi:hypothetical protein